MPLLLRLVFILTVLLVHPYSGEARDETGTSDADEVRQLKQRVLELEQKIQHQDKHLLHRPETKERARILDGLEFGLGVTGVVQGSSEADDIAGEDRTDASGSLDLEVQTGIGGQGTAFLLVEYREGAGLTDEIETLLGVRAQVLF